jgi:8-amino-3,8-dideoxy-alpha-D-manno-octulosonate transaminase
MSEIAGAIGRVQLRKLPKVIAAMRRAKAQIKAGIADLNGIKFKRINDAKGDTGAFLILILPAALKARRFAEVLNAHKIFAGLSQTMRVADFGMHVYFNIHSLVEKRSNSADGFPWTLPANRRSNYDYHKGAMPRSDALMERSIIMPIPSVMTRRDIADTIRGIRQAATGR